MLLTPANYGAPSKALSKAVAYSMGPVFKVLGLALVSLLLP